MPLFQRIRVPAGLFLLLALAGSPQASRAQTWSRTYGEGTGKSIQATQDGGAILVATVEGACPGGGTCDQAWLLKLNAAHDVEWDRLFAGDGDINPIRVVQTADLGYIVAGGTTAFGSGQRDLWVLKVDASGVVQWERALGTDGFEFGLSVRQTQDLGYVVTGSMFGPSAFDDDLWVLKLDAAGTVEWERGIRGEIGARGRSIRVTSGGTIVVGGTVFADDPSEAFLVAALDGSGTLLWEARYAVPGVTGRGRNTGLRVAEAVGGGFFLAGAQSDIYVMKTGPMGAVTWQKRLHPGFVDSVQPTGDGGVLVAMTAFGQVAGDLPDAWLVKFDADGNLVWQRAYGGARGDSLGYVAPDGSGGWLLCGATDSFGTVSPSVWAAGLDAAGGVGACCWVRDTALPSVDGTLIESSAAPSASDPAATATPGATAPAAGTLDGELLCQDSGCTLLECSSLTMDEPICDLGQKTLRAWSSCGEPPLLYEWDLDGDTITDATGNPILTDVPGDLIWMVQVTLTDDCQNPAPQSCTLDETFIYQCEPTEVSDARKGQPPLLVARDGQQITVALEARSDVYNVYADAIGSWYAPGPATGTVCGIDTWTDNGDGTITLDYAVPDSSWIVVTGSNQFGEGPAGGDWTETERTDMGTWSLCGRP